jgi:hypothetical protein
VKVAKEPEGRILRVMPRGTYSLGQVSRMRDPYSTWNRCRIFRDLKSVTGICRFRIVALTIAQA